MPVLAQVLLTALMYFALGAAKSRALKAGHVDLERRALHDDAWPDSVLKISNNIRNQFELPVLFYVVACALWQIGETDWVAQSLAWLFVASRVLHAWIHVGSNYVPARRRVFTFGFLVVLGMTGLAIKAVVDT
jgi:hypothetical protein